jgi:hypothetical protein
VKLLVWLLEPIQSQDSKQLRKELARLRSGSSAAWAIAEIVERVLSVTEVVVAVDARNRQRQRNGQTG